MVSSRLESWRWVQTAYILKYDRMYLACSLSSLQTWAHRRIVKPLCSSVCGAADLLLGRFLVLPGAGGGVACDEVNGDAAAECWFFNPVGGLKFTLWSIRTFWAASPQITPGAQRVCVSLRNTWTAPHLLAEGLPVMMGVGAGAGEALREAVVLMYWIPAGLWRVSVTGIWTVVKPLAEPSGWARNFSFAVPPAG